MMHSSLIKAKIQNSKLFWIFYMVLQTDKRQILSVGICLLTKYKRRDDISHSCVFVLI